MHLTYEYLNTSRQMLTSFKEELKNNTIIVGDFNTTLTPMDRVHRQEINKETQALKDTADQLGLTDIYRAFQSKTIDFTFFLKCTRNILQDRSHLRSQNKS